MKYKSYGTFDVATILAHIRSPEKQTVLNGFVVNVHSVRLQTFATKGIDCICCGAKGSHFSLETNSKFPPAGLHLNLYAVKECGKLVMMTKDHSVLRSAGGSDELENMNPMCEVCNTKRGSHYPVLEEFIEAYRNGTYISKKAYDKLHAPVQQIAG